MAESRHTPSINVHGVFMDIFDTGVLLTGASGTGKSELALSLIDRQHHLVADDAPELTLTEDNTIMGHCPIQLQDFLEIRGLGIINIREMFGDAVITKNKKLSLIIQLIDLELVEWHVEDRLSGRYKERMILGIGIPEYTITIAPGRNLAILVECAVRKHMLAMQGYEASADFRIRQYQLMETE